jgi:hypothetical protein
MRRGRGRTGPGAQVAALALVLALALAFTGCAASRPAPPAVDVAGARPRVALLPFENLSPRPDAGDRLSRVFAGVLGETGACQPVEPGDIEQVFAELRIRDVNGITRESIPRVAQRLDAEWLLAGTILEYGAQRTPEGDVPSVGVALRLLDGRNGRTAWTATRVRTGEDRESLFGIGRVRSLDQLAEQLARELFAGFRLPDRADTLARDTLVRNGGRP